MVKKYFEYIGETDRTKSGETAKFWEITLEGKTVSVRFGKLGTNGQGSIKELESEDAARAYAEKKITEKTKDGYIEKQNQPSIAVENSSNRWCGCKQAARSGTIEGIEFEVCTSCEKLSWEPTKTKNFIDATLSLIVDLEDPAAADDTIGNFVTWLNKVLASYEFGPKSTWKLSVDREYDDEDFSLPVGDGIHVDISLFIDDWDFDVVEDGEESGYQGLDRAELGALSGEELVKRAVRNIWSHMGDYQLYEIAKSVIEHIESQRFSSISKPTSQANFGSPVLVSYNGQDMKCFPEHWGQCNNSHGFCSGCDPQL